MFVEYFPFRKLIVSMYVSTSYTICSLLVTYIDYVRAGNQLAAKLRKEGCEIVIALTHMRTPNDVKLAKNAIGIDIILGGHDHVCEDIVENGIHIIKSGTDFRQFGLITIDTQRNADGKVNASFKAIDVTSEYAEDQELKDIIHTYSSTIDERMGEVLGNFSVELDGRFSAIRTSETNLGDWVCDVVLSATGADVVILNSGTFRSDQIHPPGPFTMRDLVNIIPMHDPLVVLEVTGQVILDALQNAVSAYPKMEGRFPQVSGVSFVFDPRKQPPETRVIPELVQVADEWLDVKQNYSLCVKSYMHGGCDGFSMFKDAKVLVSRLWQSSLWFRSLMILLISLQMSVEECPELGLTLQNHFRAIDVRLGKTKHSKHRQSLITLSRRHSMVQMLDNIELDGPTPVRRISISNTNPNSHISHHNHHHHPSTRSIDASMKRANVCTNAIDTMAIQSMWFKYFHFFIHSLVAELH